MSAVFVNYIKILGKGRNGSRSLTEQEAEEAMNLILSHQVAPEQMGAFWMLIRIREETPEEAAGFTRAIRKCLLPAIKAQLNSQQKIDLDWPAYAGKRNELPWFLLTALAIAQAGYKVVMHGHSFPEEARMFVDQVIRDLNMPVLSRLTELNEQLEKYNFVYIPLELISNELANLMNLKRLLGLRSPVNTVVRLMNPLGAKHSVHGVFHKNYDELHIAAAKLLHDPSVLVFRGGNGEAEVNPERDVSIGLLQELKGEPQTVSWSQWPKATDQHVRQKSNLDIIRLQQHWRGDITDEFGDLAIIHTMASVLGMINSETDINNNLEQARSIWQARDKEKMLG